MSLEVMRHIWKNSPSKGNARLMLLAIADNANDSGDAFPGINKLAEKCNVSHRTAQDVIHECERAGELLVYENVGTKTKSGWTNLYRIKLEGVNQPEVRRPSGEIAQPRPILDKKQRSFPKEVQPAAPLQKNQEVQLAAPDDMQPAAPHGVQLAAPKLSVYPSVQPNKETRLIYPVSIDNWKEKHLNQFFQENVSLIETLTEAVGVDLKFRPWPRMMVGERRRYAVTATQLISDEIDIRDYWAWLKKEFKWRNPFKLALGDFNNNIGQYKTDKIRVVTPKNVWAETDVPEIKDVGLTREQRKAIVASTKKAVSA